MKRSTSALLATSLMVGLGASVFLVGPASSSSFSGSDSIIAGCSPGDNCTANSLTVAATTGTGVACSSVLANCVDLGPGANNQLGTDASGRVILGTGPGSAEIWVGDSGTVSITENGTIRTTNGAVDVFNNGVITNSSGNPVTVDDVQGLRVNCRTALPTCNATLGENTQVTICATGGARTLPCRCTSDGNASPTYAWVHEWTGTVGTSTTCTP